MKLNVYYALNENGDVISVRDSIKGKTYICPKCQGELVVKYGEIKRKHFSHIKDTCVKPINTELLKIPSKISGVTLYEYHLYYKKLLNNKIRINNEKKDAHQKSVKVLQKCQKLINEHSRPYKNGKFPENRKTNNEVVKQLRAFILNKSSKVPELHKCRWSSITEYYADDIMGFSKVYKSDIWRHEGPVIAKELLEGYKLLKYPETYFNFDIPEYSINDLNKIKLYFLKVDLKEQNRILYKIGVTSRDVKERIKEIYGDLRPLGQASISIMFYISGLGYLESYIKREYISYRFDFESHEEYFEFPEAVLETLKSQLKRVSYLDINHIQKIKSGMSKNKGGRPKAPENKIAFLQKPKSKEIKILLEQGKGIREVNRITGYSINTIRKVNSIKNL